MLPVVRLHSLTLPRRDWLAALFAFGVFVLISAGIAVAQTTGSSATISSAPSGNIPANAVIVANGFAMRKDETCARVIAPANAFLAGNGKRCRAGLAREGDSYIALVVPANGYLPGNNCYCHLGWHRVKDARLRTVVPANAKLRVKR